MPRSHPRRHPSCAVTAATAVTAVTLTLLARPAAAKDADATLLVDELVTLGVPELLDRLAQQPPPDAAAAPLIAIGRALADAAAQEQQARRLAGSNPAAAAEARTAARAARELADEATAAFLADPAFADDPRRVLWLTDAALRRLFDDLRLGGRGAAEAVELGVADPEQIDLFNAAVADASAWTAEAERALLSAERRWTTDPDARRQADGAGLYTRVTDLYAAERLPLALAVTRFYHTLRPGLPAEEVRAQRATAIDRFDSFLTANPSAGETAARSMQARAKLMEAQAAGNDDDTRQVLETLRALTADGIDTLPALMAALAEARHLEREGRTQPAAALFERADQSPLAVRTPLYRVLVADVWAAALAERGGDVFAVYQPLMEDPRLNAYLRSRWARSGTPALGRQDSVERGPANVVVAQIVARERLREARQAAADGDAQRAADLFTDAAQRSRDVLAMKPDAETAAAASLDLGLAVMLADAADANAALAAVGTWLDAAEAYPSQAEAAQALGLASGVVQKLHRQAPADPTVARAYQRVGELVRGPYSGGSTAGDFLLYDAFATLQSRGQFADAAAAYAQVPFGHPRYLEAQALRVYSLRRAAEAVEAAPDTDPPGGALSRHPDAAPARTEALVLRDQARAAAEALLQDAAGAGANAAAADPERQRVADAAAARTTLELARLDAADGELDAALQRLHRLSQGRYADAAAAAEVASLRLQLLVQADRVTEARTEAAAMLERDPDAAAAAIDGVLNGLDAELQQLTAGVRRGRAGTGVDAARLLAERRGQAAVELGRLLLDATTSGNLPEAQRLAYELPYLRALRSAGRPTDALVYAEEARLSERFPNELAVLRELMEAAYAAGIREPADSTATFEVADPATAEQAAALASRLVSGLTPDAADATPRDTYWLAWSRLLAVALARGEAPSEVGLRLRQLEVSDPALGGPTHEAAFTRIRARL